MPGSPELSLKGVTLQRGSFLLRADGVFMPGVHLLTGRIGSGKTTCGKVLAGITRPDRGEISWSGTERVMLLQNAGYHVTRATVRDEAASWNTDPDTVIRLAGLSGKEELDILFLSRGELKRLELASLLSRGSDLVVLDEPFNALDDDARRWVTRLIAEAQNRIVIIISHDITSLPPVHELWETEEGVLKKIGRIPGDMRRWDKSPLLIRYLWQKGENPAGLSRSDLEEAVCRIHGSG
ncbi:MAG: ATP-binding cassette domain-containing protein [Methanospirillum sp.]|nr:ATP-binding cassette domain-containing protein [Methanospirillum sp.]